MPARIGPRSRGESHGCRAAGWAGPREQGRAESGQTEPTAGTPARRPGAGWALAVPAVYLPALAQRRRTAPEATALQADRANQGASPGTCTEGGRALRSLRLGAFH